MVLCACGCGEEIIKEKHRKGHHNPKYIYGHQKRLFSEEHRRKKSLAQMGDKNPAKKPEVRKKISESLIGRFVGEKNPNWKPKIKKICSECGNAFEILQYLKDIRQYCSNKCANLGERGSGNPMFGKVPTHSKGYYYNSPLQGIVWLRSSYEIAYAKYLDKNKILWMYEMETFELSDEMTYTPDFFLPQFEKFIDTKGYMRPEAQIKINKFLEEYPWDLEILYKEDLIKLGVEI